MKLDVRSRAALGVATPLLIVAALAGCAGGVRPEAGPPEVASEVGSTAPASPQEPTAPSGQPASGEDPAVGSAAVVETESAPPPASGPYTDEQVRAWRHWEEIGPPSEPEDGAWLVDDQGRRYFTYPVPRLEGAHLILDDGARVRLPRGLVMDLVSYDADHLYVKIYGVPEPSSSDRPDREAQRAEAAARMAAAYRPEAGAADRLRFEDFGSGLPKRGQWRNGFALADLDGDGNLDLVHGPPRKGMTSAPVVFRGDSSGTWRRWEEIEVPSLPLDYGDAAVADFDGDGIQDLALASHLRGVLVLRGVEPGRYERWSEGIDFSDPGANEGPGAFSSRELEVFDWNGDGRADIVALGEGPRLAAGGGSSEFREGSSGFVAYLNGGDGTWRRVEPETGPDRLFGDSFVLADLNGDGRDDLFLAASARGRKDLLFVRQGDGTLVRREIQELRDDAQFRASAAADFDRDGRIDLAVGYSSFSHGVWRTGVDVLLARGDGWERHTLGVEEEQVGVWALGTGDVDGDGSSDLVAATGAGILWVFLGDGKGGFVREASEELVPPGDHCTGYEVRLADLDGRPGDEIVVSFAGEPGGEVLMGAIRGEARRHCPQGGGLAAWRAVSRGPQ